MVEEYSEDKTKPQVSEGYIYFRKLLEGNPQGFVEIDLLERKILICKENFYQDAAYFSPDDPILKAILKRDELKAIIVLVGRSGTPIRELLRQPNGVTSPNILEYHQITEKGLEILAVKRNVFVRSCLTEETIPVDSGKTISTYPYPNWWLTNFCINNPEQQAGLAITLMNKIQELL